MGLTATAHTRSGPKALSSEDHAIDGEVLGRAIDACPGVEDTAVAEAWGVSHPIVSRIRAGARPLSVKRILMAPRPVAHTIVVLLADRLGFDVVDRPADDGKQDDYSLMCEVGGESGDVLRTMAAALADKVWDRAEAAAGVRELDQLILAAHRARRRLVSIVEDGAQGAKVTP